MSSGVMSRSNPGVCSRSLGTIASRRRLDPMSFLRLLQFLFAHTGSALLRVEFPRPAALLQSISAVSRLRSPTSDFEGRAQTQRAENPSPDPPKMPNPSAALGSPRLGSGDPRSGSPETDGHER